MKYLSCILSLTFLLGCILVNHNIRSNFIQYQQMLTENNIILKSLINKMDDCDKLTDFEHKIILPIENMVHEPISGIIKTDLMGVIQDISPGIQNLTDKDEDELVGTSISSLMSKHQWSIHQDSIKRIIKNGTAGVVMEREVELSDKLVQVHVNYIPTKKIFIINMKEVL